MVLWISINNSTGIIRYTYTKQNMRRRCNVIAHNHGYITYQEQFMISSLATVTYMTQYIHNKTYI